MFSAPEQSFSESTMVPFRYLSGVEGKPMMAPGMRELIIQQHLEESADGW